ncbi:hypothetical protein Acr_00g0023010 [Actinidia rufa]|uniref:Uncharacterized protein n=1 Tax=Actinidia rufa TaxID=165716 RepID=A0A7J0DCP7_9ERIC|nr:hypothetical protein Acr_00g0023010 [Actinidia rufa]
MLVRDSEALAQFRVDHRIPDDVVIERSGPNDDADWVEGEGLGSMEFPTDEPDPFSVPRHMGYVPVGFNRRFWRRSDRCSAAIRAARQGRPVLPPLQIRGPGSRPRSSLSDEVSDLFEGTSAELRRLLEEAEGESSGSSKSSSSSWDIDLGDEALNEEAEVEDGEEIIEHSYSHSGSSSSGSQVNVEIMAPKDHETCVALGNAVMLPQDVVDHAAETTAEFRGKLVMLGAQANNIEKELKQTKSELTNARSAAEIAILQRNHAQQEASDLKAFTCGEVYKKLFDHAFERAGDVYERQLAELRPDVFQEGWLAYLKELQIPLDHPAWSSPAPPVQLPASPERYSPINLPDFNEEEYATLPADEGNINTAVVEAHIGVAETADRDRVGEAEGDRAVEAEGENLV